ncbi:UDP-N-acetylglucosamine 1-carboxyvinyltransferase [Myxococcota bacterium]|nr:UDP-N-acetylglucosamine 1-carboxyvinyltransferase [Myxococcota bacterium]MBU1430815.1 UDP-N-acetylglucosamine 1-carboxyvinyltransferase [Myxococcota bacterium]MBU1899659.1 UDP-N-acetylglucosamine 1-carboxyvinyltransferase [Myxococcota bacterium]
MEKFVIQGGKPLSGRVTPSGNKNEALPAIAACLLTEEPVTLHNVPKIRDVLVMCEVIKRQGGEVEWISEHSVRICAKGITDPRLDAEACKKIRASILFIGPLVARLGQAILPPPGGDVIGRRRLDTHFLALSALGARVDLGDHLYDVRAKRLFGEDIFLDEASVTATENALMAACLAEGRTVLRNAACEPHVSGLARMLNAMGAKITGIETNQLVIEGVEALHGAEHTIDSDYLEIGSFIGLAAVTRSPLTIERINPDNLRMIRMIFQKLGVETVLEGSELFIPGDQSLVIRNDYYGLTPKIDDAIWPAFPTDLMSIAITVATQCQGTVLFFEKMFDGRMFFTDHLQSMGARTILCDPHRVVVVGPQVLRGSRVESPDVRAGMALLIAGLAARGETQIFNIHQIDRGYERIEEKLQALGADIERRVVA